MCTSTDPTLPHDRDSYMYKSALETFHKAWDEVCRTKTTQMMSGNHQRIATKAETKAGMLMKLPMVVTISLG